MIRIVVFLILIGLGAAGAAWVAEQPGDVVLTWGPLRIISSLPVAVLGVFLLVALVLLAWSTLRGLLRAPGHLRRSRRARREARGRHAITHGLLAVGHGDRSAARQHADAARRFAGNDPLTLLLHAQAAQLEGDRQAAQRAFRVMADRHDTKLLGLRGLFIEAQRAEDPVAAVMIADEALKHAPQANWASQAVLAFRCSRGDWNAALAILDSNYTAGLLDKAAYRRQRGVLLTARALELEGANRDLSRDSAMEAVKLAPTLVPAAVLAAKYESEAHQVRRAMKILEAAWAAGPHPDLADAYAHVRLGDAARQRLSRIENLAAKTPGHIEGALAVARTAIDAGSFARARTVLAPFIDDPTQRVAMLMAELERTEHADAGKAREWMLRAVRARHDPAWIADGHVSDRWRPVSPVTGQLDAYEWQTPVASLPSGRRAAIEASVFEEVMLAAPARPAIEAGPAEPPRQIAMEPRSLEPRPLEPRAVEASPSEPSPLEPTPLEPKSLEPKSFEPRSLETRSLETRSLETSPVEDEPVATLQDNAPPPVTEPEPVVAAAPVPPEPVVVTAESTPPAAVAPPIVPAPAPIAPAPAPAPAESNAPATPVVRARSDLGRADFVKVNAVATAAIPAILPIVRAPDDPGIEEEEQLPRDEFDEQIAPKAQSSGWFGFLSRFGN